MNYFYYEINTRRFIQCTTIRALEDFSGISYTKIRGWFVDGNNLHVDESVICGCSEVVKGKQRFTKKEKHIVDLTGPKGNNGPGPDPVGIPKRQTKQPENRNMKQYDDFFKEVE